MCGSVQSSKKMWDGLPADVQGAILDAFAARKACGLWNPRLLLHLPNRQFLDRVRELFLRSLCYARATTLSCRAMSANGVSDVPLFVEAVTRVIIDHVLLQRKNFPSYLMIIARVRTVISREVKSWPDTLRIWCALGYSPSCFHRSAAAEAIHAADLRKRALSRVLTYLNTIFGNLYDYRMPRIAERRLSIKEELRRSLKRLNNDTK